MEKKESPLNNKMSFGKGHSVLGLHLFVCVEKVVGTISECVRVRERVFMPELI